MRSSIMADIMFRTLVFLLALFVPAIGRAVDPPIEFLEVAPRPLEEMKFPPGTVIVVRGDAREGLGKVDAVVLSPDEYRRLIDSIDQLKKQIAPDKPQVPSKCHIVGRVEFRGQQEVVKLRATFEFVGSSVHSTWFLGLRRAAVVAAVLDGDKPPMLQSGTEGYSVAIDGPGSHVLTLDLELPLQSRGKAGERGLTLNLPGSPISVIEQFELPTGVPSVRLRPLTPAFPLVQPASFRTLDAKDLLKPAGDWPAVALGAVEGVELTWDSPGPQKPNEPLLSADGDIRVHVGDAGVETTATLLLKSLRGRNVEWKLQTPAGAEINLPGVSSDAGPTAYSMNDEKSRWIIRSEIGGAESLTVNVVVRHPKQAKPVAIGPFTLEGSLRQQGVIRIIAPNNLRAKLSGLRNDVGRRELPADAAPADVRTDSVQVVYGYGQISPTSSTAPIMFVEAEAIGGGLRTQVSHHLGLTEAGWRLTMEIVATPIRSELELLDLEIPAVLQPNVEIGPRELVEKIERVDAALNRWRIRLARPRQGETTIQLEAVYPRGEAALPNAEMTPRESATLPLPRVLHAVDRDGKVSVTVPAGYQLRGSLHEWDHDRVGAWSKELEERPGKPPAIGLSIVRPAMIELSWIPVSAVLPIRTTVDVTLEERQATALQQIAVPPSDAPRQVILQSVGPALNRVHVVSGGNLTRRANGEWLLNLTAATDRDATAILAYSFPLDESEDQSAPRQVVAMLRPITVADCDTLVRVWATGNRRPLLVEGPWDVLSPDAVAEHDRLPALVLHGDGTRTPPTLALEESTGLAPAGIIAERVLIQVTPGEGGQNRYLARFALRRVAASHLDFELPANVAAIGNLEVYLNEKRLDQVAVIDGSGAPAAANTGRIIRIPLSAQGTTAELAVSYILPEMLGATLLSGWSVNLAPPRLRGPVFVVTVRWQIMLPFDDVAIPNDRWLELDQRWGIKRGLPILLPARSSSQLEQWLRTGLENSNGESPETASSGTIARQARLGPLNLFVIPRMVWYLVCSLIALCAGGILVAARWKRWLFWLILTGMLTACAAAALSWPQGTLTFLTGTPPGLIVLALMLLIGVWQSRRYRRKVVFMPGFTRSKPLSNAGTGSSQRRLQPINADPAPVP